MKKRIAALAVSTFALASCSMVDATSAPPSVLSSALNIGVAVVNNRVTVDQEIATMGQAQDVVKFGLDALVNEFPRGAIVFEEIPTGLPAGCIAGNPAKAFMRCTRGALNTEVECKRVAGVYEPGACYKYIVTVKRRFGATLPALDPWIKNQ